MKIRYNNVYLIQNFGQNMETNMEMEIEKKIKEILKYAEKRNIIYYR